MSAVHSVAVSSGFPSTRSPAFEGLFGRAPDLTADAPGRVNLIGEHTDYNDGFVLPAAIPQRTTVQLGRRDDETVRAWSEAFPEAAPVTFPLQVERPAGDWADYVRGVARVFADHGLASGFDARISSDVPAGSGLSSSAALLIALGRALRRAFDLPIDDLALALLARTAETDFVGAPVGVMDQMACSLCDTSGALFIDTRSLAYERIALPPSAALLVVDSGVRHRHASGEYRVRREECRRAADMLGVRALRDVGPGDLEAVERLPPPLDRRARHVVTENARVLETVAALGRGDLAEVGRLFAASHASMRDDFEVSVPPVDALVRRMAAIQGVYGARLTGGGFGGAVVALADPAAVRHAVEAIVFQQESQFPREVRVIVPAVQPLEPPGA